MTQQQLQGLAMFLFTVGVPIAIWGFGTEHHCRPEYPPRDASECEKVNLVGTTPLGEEVGLVVVAIVAVMLLISLALPRGPD